MISVLIFCCWYLAVAALSKLVHNASRSVCDSNFSIFCFLSLGPMTPYDTLLLLICLLGLLCGTQNSILSPIIGHILLISIIVTGPNAEPYKGQILKKPSLGCIKRNFIAESSD